MYLYTLTSHCFSSWAEQWNSHISSVSGKALEVVKKKKKKSLIIILVCGEKERRKITWCSCRKLCGLPVWVSYSSEEKRSMVQVASFMLAVLFCVCKLQRSSEQKCMPMRYPGGFGKYQRKKESERLKMALEIRSQEQTMCLACTPASTAAVSWVPVQ